MLHNLGWENSKLCQKDQVLKEARQAKKPTKRNLVVVQKDHFKCIWLAKKQLNLNYKNISYQLKLTYVPYLFTKTATLNCLFLKVLKFLFSFIQHSFHVSLFTCFFFRKVF